MRLGVMLGVLVITPGLASGCAKEGGDSVADGDTMAEEARPGCEAPEAILLEDGRDSGFVRCADGSENRRAVVAARLEDDPVPPIDYVPCEPHSFDHWECDQAACEAIPFSTCARTENDHYSGCACVTGCRNDDDCEPDEICFPPAVSNHFMPVCGRASCKSNDDCETRECGLSRPAYYETFAIPVAACRNPNDVCRGGDDWKMGDMCCGIGTDGWEYNQYCGF